MSLERLKQLSLTIRKWSVHLGTERLGLDHMGFDRVLLVVLGLAVLVLLWFGMGRELTGWDDAEEKVTFLQIGTGSTGGTYFPMGQALAAVISHPPGSDVCVPGGRCGVAGLVAIAKASAGSVANARAVADGRLDSALIQANVLAAAYAGQGDFKGEPPRENLRVIANLYPEAIHLVVVRGLDVRSPADLKGMRVSIGPQGSGTQADARAILQAFGLKLQDVEILEVDASRSAEMILSGMLDAYFLVAGAPARSIEDLAVRGAIDLVPIAGAPAENLRLERAFYSGLTIPEGTYRHIESVETLGIGALWVTRSTEPNELVYKMTRALFDERNRATLISAHGSGRDVSLETAVQGVPILLHPGAERFYFEAGVLER
ncbi:MAG: TAXI family TRAP transporter solute-binding subunit [Parvibaculum sp.]